MSNSELDIDTVNDIGRVCICTHELTRGLVMPVYARSSITTAAFPRKASADHGTEAWPEHLGSSRCRVLVGAHATNGTMSRT